MFCRTLLAYSQRHKTSEKRLPSVCYCSINEPLVVSLNRPVRDDQSILTWRERLSWNANACLVDINFRRDKYTKMWIRRHLRKTRQEQNEYVDGGRRFKMACAQANQSQLANLIVLGLSSNAKYNLRQLLSYSTYTRDLWLWLEMGIGLKMKPSWVLHTHNYH